MKNLHSIMLIEDGDPHFVNTFGNIFQDASNLGLLHLSSSCCFGESLLHLFSKAIHLFYLKLQNTVFPDELSAYYLLKVLETDANLESIPVNICDLINLRHLITDEHLHSQIGNVGRLVHLQELTRFTVGIDDAFKLEQIGNMKELSGSLAIHSLHNVETVESARAAKLEEKRLKRLSLSWDPNFVNIQFETIESLRPNKYLKELLVDSYGGKYIPTWLRNEAYHECLESLHLRYCFAWKTFCLLDILSSLKYLTIVRLNCITKFEFGKYEDVTRMNFKYLEQLMIEDMSELLELNINLDFPNLKRDVQSY